MDLGYPPKTKKLGGRRALQCGRDLQLIHIESLYNYHNLIDSNYSEPTSEHRCIPGSLKILVIFFHWAIEI